MFFETYQISRQLTEQLLEQLVHPCHEEIIKNCEMVKNFESEMVITETSDGVSVEFSELDLSFLNDALENEIIYSLSTLETVTLFSIDFNNLFEWKQTEPKAA